MSKVRDLVTSTEKLVPSTRRTGRSSFAGFRRADEEEKRLVKEEKHRIEVAKIAREATIFNEKKAAKAARIKAVEDEEKRVIEEQNRIIRTDFVKNKMSNAFGTKTKIDSEPTRQSVVDNILPKAFIPEQAYPEPFEEEPLLNKELADFKKKINEHLHKMGFASGSGGGIGDIADAGDIDIGTAKVDGKFLKYSSSSAKWIGADPTDISHAITALDIDGGTDIGAAIVDADLFIIDDGASGANRKTVASRIKTYIADVTLTTAAQANITSLGTLTTLTIDSIIINGTNIGHTSDTDALAIDSSGNVTASQNLIVSGNFTGNGQTTSDSFNLPITLNGTDGSSTNAGDNIVQNTAANENDRIVYEDATPTHFEKSITWDNVG